MKIVKVLWKDAQSGYREPMTKKELEKEEVPLIRSAGYLVVDNKEYIVLGFMVYPKDEFIHWLQIPKEYIKEMKVLK